MTIAIIGDIHGNTAAFQAVLADARAQGAQHYLLAGDLLGDFPHPMQIIELVRDMQERGVAHCIRGNREEYLTELLYPGAPAWELDQFAAICWNYRHLPGELRCFLTALPRELDLREEKTHIRMAHKPEYFFERTSVVNFDTVWMHRQMREQGACRREVIAQIPPVLERDERLLQTLSTLAGDIFVFAHTHLQWHGSVGGKLLINPGSCGAPMDWEVAAPYTLLSIGGAEARVQERRVPYDIRAAARDLMESELGRKAPVWSELNANVLLTGEDLVWEYFEFLKGFAREQGFSGWPYPNHLWNGALPRWREQFHSAHPALLPRETPDW